MDKQLYVVRDDYNNYIYVVRAESAYKAEELVSSYTDLKGISWIVELADNNDIIE